MNPRVKNIKTEVLADNWYTLRKVTYDFRKTIMLLQFATINKLL